MGLLNSQDKEIIKRALPKSSNKIIDVTVARLYIAYPDKTEWQYTGLSGAITLIDDLVGHTFFLKLIDIFGHRGVLWDQELYVNFQYFQDRTFFHTFEIEDCYVGLLFIDIREAEHFLKRVQKREKYASRATLQNKKAIALTKKLKDENSKKAPKAGPRGETVVVIDSQRRRYNYGEAEHIPNTKNKAPPPPPPSVDTYADETDEDDGFDEDAYYNSTETDAHTIKSSAISSPPPADARATSPAVTHHETETEKTEEPKPQRTKHFVPPLPPNFQPAPPLNNTVNNVPPPLPGQGYNNQPPQPPQPPQQQSNAFPIPIPQQNNMNRPVPQLPNRNNSMPMPMGMNNSMNNNNMHRPVPMPPPRQNNMGNGPPPPPARRGPAPPLPPHRNNNMSPPMGMNNQRMPSTSGGAPPPPPARRGPAPPPPPARSRPQPQTSFGQSPPPQQQYNQQQQMPQTSFGQPPQQQQQGQFSPPPVFGQPQQQQQGQFSPPPVFGQPAPPQMEMPPTTFNTNTNQGVQSPAPVAPPLPPVGNNAAAPPAPPMMNNNNSAAPIAPPPPPMMNNNNNAGVPVAPPPPPMMNGGGQPPAPPPPPMMGGGAPAPTLNESTGDAGRDALLASIRGVGGVAALKKVDKSQLDKPSVLLQEVRGEPTSAPTGGSGAPPPGAGPGAGGPPSLADALAAALNKRKNKVGAHDDDDAADDW